MEKSSFPATMAKDQFRLESKAEPLSNVKIAEHSTPHQQHKGHVDPTCAWCVYDAHLDGDESFLARVSEQFRNQAIAALEAIKSRRSTDTKLRLYDIVKNAVQDGDELVRPSELLAKAHSNDGNY